MPCQPDRALRRRSHARRIRLWRGLADFAGSARACDRGPAQRDQCRRRRQRRAQYRLARRALHLRRIDRRRRSGRETEGRAFAGRPDRGRAGFRSRPPDDAKGAFRLRAFFHPYAARRLGTGAAGGARHRTEADRRHPAAVAARRYRAAVRLRQGRADGARDPQRHRRRQEARQARDRRSQERQSGDLSRRDAADAQPQGIRRSDPQPRRHRTGHCRCRPGRDGIWPIAKPCW